MDRFVNDFQVSCNNCHLDAICLPRGLTKNEVEDLSIAVKSDAVIQKGDYIYRQGDIFHSIIAIKSGSAKLVANDAHGKEHILNVLLPGELIGFDGLYENKYNCSAIALEVMSYCALPADDFEALCVKVPAIGRALFKHSSEAINESQSQVVTNKYSAEEKLAIFLTGMSNRLSKRGFSGLEFNIPLTRQEMGDHLGMTLETVSRMLKQFQDEALIEVQRKHIKIKNLPRLHEISNG